MNTQLAIIPARGGSKRIPKKNIKNFCGRPMISYILNTAGESQLFNKIHVSTDSDEIYKIVSDIGFEPSFMRPNELATDTTPIMPVLEHVVDEFDKQKIYFDTVWLLMACTPLLSSSILKEAYSQYIANNSQPLIAISKYNVPIEWAYRLDKNKNLLPLNREFLSKRSQDIETKYYESGAFVIYPIDYIRNKLYKDSSNYFQGFVMPSHLSIDIDDQEDWTLAERIYLSK